MTGGADAVQQTWTLRQVLEVPALAGARLLAGHAGLDRVVEGLSVGAVPDVPCSTRPGEFLLATAHPLHDHPESPDQIIVDLDDAGLSALGIMFEEHIEQPSPRLLDMANERGLPVVQLPPGTSFDDVLNGFLSANLERQTRQSGQREQIRSMFLEIVLNGQGLAEISARLAEVIQRPVAIVESGGAILASTQTDGLSAGSGPLTSVHLTDDNQAVLIDHRLVACLQAPVRAGSRLHGHVVAFGRSDGVSDEHFSIESAATAAALILAKQSEVVAQVQRYQSDFMRQLLRGSITEASDVRRWSEPFGWDLGRRMIVLVLKCDDPQQNSMHGNLSPIPLAIRSPILTRDPKAAVVNLSDEIVVVTEAFAWENGRANALRYARSIQEIATRAYGASVSVGMSRPVTQELDIPRAYDQAVTAFRVGRRLQGPGVASHFNELGVNRILSLVEDQDELDSFAQEVLGELAGNSERISDLRRTLEVLLETNVNVSESARRLHYHYNTLRFRIEKLEQLVGPFRDDAQVRLNVHLALLIRRMRNPPS